MPSTWKELEGKWSKKKRRLLIDNGALAAVLYDRMIKANIFRFKKRYNFLDGLTDFFEKEKDRNTNIKTIEEEANSRLGKFINIIPPYKELNTYLKHVGPMVYELLSFKVVIDILLNYYETKDAPLFQHLKHEVLPLQISFYSHPHLDDRFFHAIQKNMLGLMYYGSIVLL